MNATADELDSYGLFTAEAVQDPYPYYRRMREREPVHWSEKAQAWYFTRYCDVLELQDRPDLSVDRIETLYSYLPQTNPARFSDIVARTTTAGSSTATTTIMIASRRCFSRP
jgi:cytochrome P450